MHKSKAYCEPLPLLPDGAYAALDAERRQRTGAFATPPQYVKLAQEYVAKWLGSRWYSDYWVWDCAAGQGNLLAGLPYSDRVFATTLEHGDVQTLHRRVDCGEIKIPHGNIAQFDFLNDDYSKLPHVLQSVIRCAPERMVMYINPPFGANKGAQHTMAAQKWGREMGAARQELMCLFWERISRTMPTCRLASWGKHVPPNCREWLWCGWGGEYGGGNCASIFIVPSFGFDGVKGGFPSCFICGKWAAILIVCISALPSTTPMASRTRTSRGIMFGSAVDYSKVSMIFFSYKATYTDGAMFKTRIQCYSWGDAMMRARQTMDNTCIQKITIRIVKYRAGRDSVKTAEMTFTYDKPYYYSNNENPDF